MSEADLRTTADALLRHLPVAVELDEMPEAPRSIEDVLRSLGATDKERVRRGAIAMAGTSKYSDKRYRTARRFIERRLDRGQKERRGTTPKGRAAGISRLLRAVARPNIPGRASLSVSIRAHVLYANRTQTMPAGGPLTMGPGNLVEVRRHLRDGDKIAAARSLLDSFVYVYGLASARDVTGVIGNIEDITVGVN